MWKTSTTASRAAAIVTTTLLACIVLAACGSSQSTVKLAADTHVVCVTPSDHHVLVSRRSDGTPEAPVPDRRTGQQIACKTPQAPASTKLDSAPDTASCLPTATTERPDESVCLFWYNESTLNLSMWSASCSDGHISPGTYDSYPNESYSLLPSNTFLTQDFDPSEGEGKNTRVQCKIIWNQQGAGPALEASFNYDELSSPTTLSISAHAAPNYSIPLSAFVAPVNNNMATVVLCDQNEPLCSGSYKCPNGSEWMSCEFGAKPTADDETSPILSDVSMPGSHDAGTYSMEPAPFLPVCSSKGKPLEGLVPEIIENWARTQVGNTFEQASAGSRYFDVRGIDPEGLGVRHCHTLPAATWSEIFGVPLDTPLKGPGHGLIQFGEQHPGEIMVVDFTHMYDPATPGTRQFEAVKSDLKELCKYAIPPKEFGSPGSTPINQLRHYAIEHEKYFLFYMTTTDSAEPSSSTDPYSEYGKAVEDCLYPESTGNEKGEGIIDSSYDEESSADPLLDYVSPITKPATAFTNFQLAQYNLAHYEYEKVAKSGNEDLWVSQYIWAPTEINASTLPYIASDTLRDWTELGLVHSYEYNNPDPEPFELEPAPYPNGAQFVTGLDRAALARGFTSAGKIQPPNIVLIDDVAKSFWTWGPSGHQINALPMIWNQEYPEPVRVTVKTTSSGSSGGIVSDQDGLLNCSSSSTEGCSAKLPVGDVLTGSPSSGSEFVGFSGAVCATGQVCTVAKAGTVTAEFAPFQLTPPRNLSLTPENGGFAALWQAPDFDGGSPIVSYTVTAYLQGETGHQHSLGQCTVEPEKNPGSYLECEVKGLTNGSTYWAIVQAKNEAGATSNSTTSPWVTPSAAPGAIPGLRSAKPHT